MVEKSDTVSQALSDSVQGLNISSKRGSSNSALLPPSRPRRFAVTRGFDNQGILQLNKSRDSLPVHFLPAAGSTPLSSPQRLANKKLIGISSLNRYTSEQEKISSSLPPRRPNSVPLIPLPGTKSKDLARPTVITPVGTPDTSLDWDNYFNTPTYGPSLGSHRQDTVEPSSEAHLITNFKITLVPTSESSLSASSEASMSRFTVDPIHMDNTTRAQLQQEMNNKSKELMSLHQNVLDLIDDYAVDDICSGNADRVDMRLKEVSDARAEFRSAVRNYKELYGEYGDSENRLESLLTSINQSVRDHSRRIWEKVSQICPPMSQYEKESLALQKEQFEQQKKFQQEQLTEQRTRSSSHRSGNVEDRQNYGIRSCEGKRMLYRDQLRFLKESLCLPDYESIEDHWKQQTEADIRKAMRKVDNWEKSLITLSKSFRDYEVLSRQYEDNTEEFEQDEQDYIEIRNKLKEVVIAVQSEDEKRNLQTLEHAKSDKVSYPSFNGDAGEDLIRFREKMNECFKKNRVPESDQIDRLRENLK